MNKCTAVSLSYFPFLPQKCILTAQFSLWLTEQKTNIQVCSACPLAKPQSRAQVHPCIKSALRSVEHSILNIVFPKLLPCFFLNFTEYSPSPLAALKLTVTKMYEHHIIWENTCCYRAKETKMTKKKPHDPRS